MPRQKVVGGDLKGITRVEHWQSEYVTANGVRLHYTRTGGDKPPVVLAHGVTDNGLCWAPVAAALAADYDVIMVDARGHGRSQATESGYDPATQADDLAGLIAALDLQQPAVLGHSMGAATALVLAGAHADVPGAILLEDPPHWWTDWYETTDAHDRVGEMRAAAIERQRKPRHELIAEQRENSPGWSDDELEPWADAKQAVSLHALSVFDRANPKTVDWAATLRGVTCPALLITADPELGGIVTDETAAALKELVPQLEVVNILDAGHSIRRDQFARYLEVIRSFLARNTGWRSSRGNRACPWQRSEVDDMTAEERAELLRIEERILVVLSHVSPCQPRALIAELRGEGFSEDLIRAAIWFLVDARKIDFGPHRELVVGTAAGGGYGRTG